MEIRGVSSAAHAMNSAVGTTAHEESAPVSKQAAVYGRFQSGINYVVKGGTAFKDTEAGHSFRRRQKAEFFVKPSRPRTGKGADFE